MALTATEMERGGWRNQARRLALVPMAAATDFALVEPPPPTPPLVRWTEDAPPPETALPAAEPRPQPDSAPSLGDHAATHHAAPNLAASDLMAPDLLASDLAALRKLIAVKTTAAKMLNERIRKLSGDGSAKDKRIAELEIQLLTAREDLAHSDNENNSLQASLDLTLGESARLSGRVWDSGVEADALKAQVESAKSALRTVETERDRLNVTIQEARELHRAETEFLNGQIEAMAARAAAVEDKLTEAQRSLAARTEESKEALRKAMEAGLLRNAAEEELGEARARLQTSENKISELEQSRARLMDEVGALLEAFEVRAAALAASEDRAKTLERRLLDAEAKAKAGVDSAAKAEARLAAVLGEIDRLSLQLQNQDSTPIATAEAEHIARALVRRVEEAEATSALAQDQIESLNAKTQNQQAALAEAANAIQSLVDQVARAEANSGAAQSAVQELTSELQHEQARRAIAEVAFSKVDTEATRLRNEVNRLRNSVVKAEAAQAEVKQAEDKSAESKRTEGERPEGGPVAGEYIERGVAAAATRSAQSLLAATISL
jgi:chromosome segregation ATPase